jgi:hypothetical protein
MEPVRVIDSGNWLVMMMVDSSAMIFDRFGTYYKSVKIPLLQFQADGDMLLYKENTGMTRHEIPTGKTDRFLLPENRPVDQCRVEGNHIFISTPEGFKIYTY